MSAETPEYLAELATEVMYGLRDTLDEQLTNSQRLREYPYALIVGTSETLIRMVGLFDGKTRPIVFSRIIEMISDAAKREQT